MLAGQAVRTACMYIHSAVQQLCRMALILLAGRVVHNSTQHMYTCIYMCVYIRLYTHFTVQQPCLMGFTCWTGNAQQYAPHVCMYIPARVQQPCCMGRVVLAGQVEAMQCRGNHAAIAYESSIELYGSVNDALVLLKVTQAKYCRAECHKCKLSQGAGLLCSAVLAYRCKQASEGLCCFLLVLLILWSTCTPWCTAHIQAGILACAHWGASR